MRLSLQLRAILSLFALVLLTAPALHSQVFYAANASQAPQLIASAGTDQTICPGDTAMLGGNPTATGGTGSYTYSWFPTTGLSSGSTANPSANPAATTQYLLSITDAENCKATDTLTLVVDTCVFIDPSKLPVRVTLFPNPTEGLFDLQLSGNGIDGQLNLSITNTMGQVLVNDRLEVVNGQSQKQLSLMDAASGVYFVNLSRNGQSAVFRIVKK